MTTKTRETLLGARLLTPDLMALSSWPRTRLPGSAELRSSGTRSNLPRSNRYTLISLARLNDRGVP